MLLVASATTRAVGALVVTDDLGRRLPGNPPAQRIVTLSPHATELVLAAGAARHLVGVAAGSQDDGHNGALPRIGGWSGLDRETVLALRPDLAIAWHSGNRTADLAWLERIGVRVYRSEPRNLEDIARGITAIGVLTDNQPAARQATIGFYRAIRSACSNLPGVPVYVRVWSHPELTVGGDHWINAVLRAAGYRNVLAQVPRGVFAIAPETALGYRDITQIGLERRYDDSPADRLADALSRPGPGLAEAVETLCQRRLGETPTPTEPDGVAHRGR